MKSIWKSFWTFFVSLKLFLNDKLFKNVKLKKWQNKPAACGQECQRTFKCANIIISLPFCKPSNPLDSQACPCPPHQFQLVRANICAPIPSSWAPRGMRLPRPVGARSCIWAAEPALDPVCPTSETDCC